MVILDTTSKSLEVVLGGAITTTQPSWVTAYVEVITATFAMSAMSSSDGATNSATAVTMVSAPASGKARQLKSAFLHNADTANVTVTIRLNNGGTFRTIFKAVLATLETLRFSESGWQVFTANGELKVANTI